jgi:hypothetical protein
LTNKQGQAVAVAKQAEQQILPEVHEGEDDDGKVVLTEALLAMRRELRKRAGDRGVDILRRTMLRRMKQQNTDDVSSGQGGGNDRLI